MACANPFPLYNNNREFVSLIPCGKCINCIVDTRNKYDDLCQEEAFQCGYMCSYVTLTYDKYHLPYVDDWHGNLKATLVRNDYVKFVKRLRKYISYHNINNVGCRPNFKYLVCGEYGDDNKQLPRPHFHFIFFGLDYRFCNDIFLKCWKYGQIKVLPVQNGCFRYVCSYISKQVHSYENPQEVYDKHNLVRPFLAHSIGLGATLFQRQRDFIMSEENNYCYKSRKNVLRPVPQYYMHKYCLYRIDSTKKEKQKQVKNYYDFNKRPFSLKLYNDIMRQKSQSRAKSLAFKLRSRGEPVRDVYFDKVDVSTPKDVKEYISALQSYTNMEIVTNQDVFDVLVQFPDVMDEFISFGKFKDSAKFPTYRNIRQVAYDMKKYGNLVPF